MSKTILHCAICREEASAPCVGCRVGSNDGDCDTQTNVLCSHSYHSHCIERWLKRRSVCPLCNRPWIKNTAEYTLQDRAALVFLGDEEKVLELVSTELPPDAYETLSKHTLGLQTKRNRLPESKQRLLALTFAEYLTQDELKSMIIPSKTTETPPKS